MALLKKLALALTVALALNFVGLIVAGVMVAQRAGLNKEKLGEVKAVLFPPPVEAEAESEAAAEPAEPSPMDELYAMLEAQSGKPADDRVSGVSREFDQRLASIQREQRELDDRLAQLARATDRLSAERKTHAAEVASWREAVDAAAARATDKGFAEALALYEAMPARQAKDVLGGLDETVALQFLRAMDTRAASKILKEFQQGPETEQVRRLLELMRVGDLAAADPFAEQPTN